MANWWDSAPLANAPQAAPSANAAGNWWDSAPLANPPAPQLPPDQTTWSDRLVKGLRDPIEGAGQMLYKALPDALFAKDPATGKSVRELALERIDQSNKDYATQRGENAGKFDALRTVGNIGATIPLAMAAPATLAGGTAVGAATGALQPVDGQTDQFWTEKAKQAAFGAATGAIGTGIAKGAARILSPNVSPEVAAMQKAGVDLPAGRALGGISEAAEGALRDMPVGGNFVRAAEDRTLKQFNVASVNEALKPLGVAFDTRATAPGNELFSKASDAVRNAYAEAGAKIAGKVDDAFRTDISAVISQAQKLTPEMRDQVAGVLSSNLKIADGAALNGAELLTTKANFRDLAYAAKKAGEDGAAAIYRTVEEGIDGLIKRISPDGYTLAKGADAAYRNMRAIQGAVNKSLGDGIFSPAQLAAASRTVSGAGATARGEGVLQPFAQAGMNALEGMGKPAAARDAMSLLASPATLGLGVATAPFYSAPAQRAIMGMANSRGAQAAAFADALRSLGPYVSGGAAAIENNMPSPPRRLPQSTQPSAAAMARAI